MRYRALFAGVSIVGLLAAPIAQAQDVTPDPTAPNEAFAVAPKPGGFAAMAAPAGTITDADAPPILHEDELLFHEMYAADHDAALKPDWMVAHYIDVGQGAAVLLEFSCGAALIDTGGEEDEYVDGNARLMAYQKAFFARRGDLKKTLDVVFLTHAHAAHTIDRAIYATGWDGDVLMTASANGDKKVHTK
jgi:beta-lactamase superfamily II metal-dependent hydrolase